MGETDGHYKFIYTEDNKMMYRLEYQETNVSSQDSQTWEVQTSFEMASDQQAMEKVDEIKKQVSGCGHVLKIRRLARIDREEVLTLLLVSVF